MAKEEGKYDAKLSGERADQENLVLPPRARAGQILCTLPDPAHAASPLHALRSRACYDLHVRACRARVLLWQMVKRQARCAGRADHGAPPTWPS